MLRVLLAITVLLPPAALAQADGGTAPQGRWTTLAKAKRPLWATVKTSKGDIVLRLYSEDAPNTVANFVALASGEREWTHPFTLQTSSRPLYDGTTFHRVIPGFMIQGGDPTGTGRGGPGYRFPDEPGRTFDKPGLVAMANYGPDTNGSQFFITVHPPERPAAHLNGRHTVFGEVVFGYDVVQALSQVPVDSRGRPSEEALLIQKIEVSDRAPKAAAKKSK